MERPSCEDIGKLLEADKSSNGVNTHRMLSPHAVHRIRIALLHGGVKRTNIDQISVRLQKAFQTAKVSSMHTYGVHCRESQANMLVLTLLLMGTKF